jgi:hypothetical protein
MLITLDISEYSVGRPEISENGRSLLISNMTFTSELDENLFPLVLILYYSSNILFMGAVGLVFAPQAPLVVALAAIVFWISSWVYKYQLMFVYTSKVETGGVSVAS